MFQIKTKFEANNKKLSPELLESFGEFKWNSADSPFSWTLFK